MKDQRLVQLSGEANMSTKKLALLFVERSVPIVVQTGFSNRNDSIVRRQYSNLLEIGIGGVLDFRRMQRRHDVKARVLLSQLEGSINGRNIDGWQNNVRNSRTVRALENLIEIRFKLFEENVGVSVDYHGTKLTRVALNTLVYTKH